MSIQNILRWNPDPHPNLIGYDVTVNAGASIRVPSNVYLDTSLYGSTATADAIVYTVVAVVDQTVGPSVALEEIPDEATDLRVSRWRIDTTRFPVCLVEGNLLTVAGLVPIRPEIRVSVFWQDTPHLVSTGGYLLGDEVSVYANSLGEFSIPMIQGTSAFLHIPSAHVHGTFLVPDDASVNLTELTIESIDILRNN